MRWTFRPPWWAWIGVLVFGGLFLSLGTWQMGRAQYKRAMEAAYATAGTQRAFELDASSPAAHVDEVRMALALGRLDLDRQLLLDNQPRNGVPGYRVWTPMVLEDGATWIMVDRGWVPADPQRDRLPDVDVQGAAEREVRGYWRPLPRPGLRLADRNCESKGFPRVVNFPTVDELRCIFAVHVLDGVLLLAADQPDGFVREWALPNPVPPSRHYAYAAQWYAFAATLLFLFVKLNLKRRL